MIKSVLALVGFAVVASLLMQGVGHVSNETGLTTRISHEIDKHVTPTEKEMAADFLYETVRIISIPQTEAYKLAYRLAGKEYEGDVADARQLLLDTGFIENADGTWNGLLCVAAEVLTDPLSYVAVAGASKRAVKAADATADAAKPAAKASRNLAVNAAKIGEEGERLVAARLRKEGKILLPTKMNGNQGFDFMYYDIDEIVSFHEVKANTARLGKVSSGHQQMSPEHILETLNRMLLSKDPSVVASGKIGMKAFKAGKYRSVLERVDMETKTSVVKDIADPSVPALSFSLGA